MWEYKVMFIKDWKIKFPDTTSFILNKAGIEGWEAVSMQDSHILFKRPLKKNK